MRVELVHAGGRVVVYANRPMDAEQAREKAREARRRFPNIAEVVARDAIGQPLCRLRKR
jgi:phosphoribosylamine-glycine ligase